MRTFNVGDQKRAIGSYSRPDTLLVDVFDVGSTSPIWPYTVMDFRTFQCCQAVGRSSRKIGLLLISDREGAGWDSPSCVSNRKVVVYVSILPLGKLAPTLPSEEASFPIGGVLGGRTLVMSESFSCGSPR